MPQPEGSNGLTHTLLGEQSVSRKALALDFNKYIDEHKQIIFSINTGLQIMTRAAGELQRHGENTVNLFESLPQSSSRLETYNSTHSFQSSYQSNNGLASPRADVASLHSSWGTKPSKDISDRASALRSVVSFDDTLHESLAISTEEGIDSKDNPEDFADESRSAMAPSPEPEDEVEMLSSVMSPMSPHDEDSPNRAPKKAKSFGSFSKHRKSSLDFGSPTRIEKVTLRTRLRKLLDNGLVQCISASLILFTIVLICFDTNARASNTDPPVWVDPTMAFCFIAYVLEFAATLYVEKGKALHEYWTYIDAFVIFTSCIEYFLWVLDVDGFELLRLLRLCRLLRLGRVIRALKLLRTVAWFKEQYLLCMMMASCVRTVCWAFIFCFFVMTIWAVIAVELLNDTVKEIAASDSDVWSGCVRCERSFESIWDSILTFMQTIIAGDSWGLVAIPVIEKKWWSVVIFLGCLSSVIFGVLNMITVVVIDTFAERRSKNVSEMVQDMEYDEVQEKRKLKAMFAQIDGDNSGALSQQELIEGSQRCLEFHNYLRVLDIDDVDLKEFFHMVDWDGSGEIDPDEFIEALYRLRNTDSKTATRFVKHMVNNMHSNLEEIKERLSTQLEKVEKGDQSESVQRLLSNHACEINKSVAYQIEKAVTDAFDSVTESAASRASLAIHHVISSTSNHLAEINDQVSLRASGRESRVSFRRSPSFSSKTSLPNLVVAQPSAMGMVQPMAASSPFLLSDLRLQFESNGLYDDRKDRAGQNDALSNCHQNDQLSNGLHSRRCIRLGEASVPGAQTLRM